MPRRHLIACIVAAAVASLPGVAACDSAQAETALAAQTSSQAGVKISVEPRGFSPGAKTWDFAVTLETHTEALGDDLARTSTLVADGKPYLPTAWRGDPPGGHHRKGVLRFYAVVPRPHSVELQIHRRGEAQPRLFRWQLPAAP
jgi:hypothetical protein